MSIRRLSIAVLMLGALACGLLTMPALADSQARIVRLSDVEGTVQIDRNTGQGYEKAFLNMPITEGTKLWAKDDGRAEVEFEDGSVARITPDTKIEFSQLSLRESGSKNTNVKLEEGTAYVNFTGQKNSELSLNFARETVRLTHAAHFRVDLEDTDATLAVLKGDVEVEGPSGTVEVGKKQTATFDLADQDRYTVAKNFESDPDDNWNKQQDQYHERYLNANSYTSSMPYSYGVSDLNYYGNYYNVPGYGLCWQPYFTGAGWDPFMNGAWAWSPGFGYTWVSAYPWGWMPYYYGSWVYVPGFGWGWQPGGWHGWGGGIHYVGAAAAGFHPPVAPVGTVSTVAVGKGGPPVTTVPPMHLVVNNGSAGLGIPRGSYGSLRHLNTQVAKTGSVELRAAPSFAASSSHSGYGHGAAHPTASSSHVSSASSGHSSGGTSHSSHH